MGDRSLKQKTVSRTGDNCLETVDFRTPKQETNAKTQVLTIKESPEWFLIPSFYIYASKYEGLQENLMSQCSISSK